MKGITIRMDEREWAELNAGFSRLLGSVGVRISRHQFVKSCIKLGIEKLTPKKENDKK